MKTNSLICLILLVFSLVSCDKTGDITGNPMNDKDINNTHDNAPANISGKDLILYNSKTKDTLQVFEFISCNQCTVKIPGSLFKLTSLPCYTYLKNTANEANLVVEYAEKLLLRSDYTNSNYTYTVVLSFTNESGGSYSGTAKTECTGNAFGINGNCTQSISGTFTLYKNSDLYL